MALFPAFLVGAFVDVWGCTLVSASLKIRKQNKTRIQKWGYLVFRPFQ